MQKLRSAFIIFAVLIIGMTAAAVSIQNKAPNPTGGYAVELNEIERLIEEGKSEDAILHTEALRKEIRTKKAASANNGIFVMGGACLLYLLLVGGYCYFAIVRPFGRLTSFAERVALGDL